MNLRQTSRKTLWLVSAFLLQICLVTPAALAATSISQHGITWTFDRDYPSGQFANGDYWVVGPVKITSISPRSVVSGGATLHGSMINPAVNGSQGYDSRIKNNTFSAALNVAKQFPLTVQPGSSLLSAESYTAGATGDNPQMKTIAILTVLSAPAPAGSFRPPYVGGDKTIRWNKSQLQYGKLRSLPPVSGTPSLASVEQAFERPWIEQKTNWSGRYMHPGANQPTYGREMAHVLANGLLSLQLNYTAAQKEKLAIRLVQYGIDIYGAAKAGGVWVNDGGHNQGRKMPLLLAGIMLGDSNILAYANGATSRIFQEDQQTWYVTSADVGRALYTADGRPRVPYISSDVGIAEWGEKHTGDPSRDGRNWDAYYRSVSGACTIGHVLTARLMGAEKIWNWGAVFDYYDRYFANEKGNVSTGVNSIQPFVAAMWNAYRSSKAAEFTEENVATRIWENTTIPTQTGAFTIAFDAMPSSDKMDGVIGLSQGAAKDYTHLAAAVRFAPNGYIDARNGSGFKAATAVAYRAGVKYRFVMTVDVAAKRYSVTVTPAGGSTVRLADNWQFRTEQARVTSLDRVGFYAATGAHAVLDLAVQSATGAAAPAPTAPAPAPTTPAPAPSAPTVAPLKNGSFESGLTDWTGSGNRSVRASDATYPATAGSKLLVFNSGQTTPNGVVSQTLATKPGVTYTLTFDMGVLAFNKKEQRLNVTVKGSATQVSSTSSLLGIGNGKTTWKTITYKFVADSSSTVLTFKDVSPTSDSLDLLLDNVRVTP